MADAGAPTGAGGEFAYFFTTRIPHIIDQLIKLQGLAINRGESRLFDEVGAILTGLIKDVNKTAQEFCGISMELIVARIAATASRSRPSTGQMETHVRSEPGPYGLVRVGVLSELEKIVNPRGGYGTFWRAQEFGTGTDEVPSQRDRVIFGTFYDSEEPPDPAQAGLGAGHDIAFIPMGSAPGEGTIGVELPGRHFLRDGSNEAGERYLIRMREIQSLYVERINALVEQMQTRRGSRTYVASISA